MLTPKIATIGSKRHSATVTTQAAWSELFVGMWVPHNPVSTRSHGGGVAA